MLGRRYMPLGIVCALLATVLTLGIEWRYFPFRKDESLAFFLTHFLTDKPTTKLILIALGIGMAGWFGMGRDGLAWFGRREVVGRSRTQGED
jgi:hypothetical protein